MRDWDALYKKIGPLRYQASKSDCVPTTVVNGVMVVTEAQLKPRLLQLIWSVSIDTKKGTGWVCSQLISDILTAWFQRAYQDNYENDALPYKSEIVEGKSVHLNPNNAISKCLITGGVVCVTTKNGLHYSLILDEDEKGQFLGFDPLWSTRKLSDDYSKFKGLVNCIWTRDELTQEIANENNKWIHLISKVPC